MIRQAAIIGIVTLHLAMPTVLNNYPDRVQPDVDGYIARIDCGEIGRRYVLELYPLSLHDALPISEERRVGKECKIGRASCRERV